jgi:type VII secretion protein EccB
MQTRKDLLQAHRLMTQRAAQALLIGEPDSPELPLRRINVASFIGIMVAVLVGAGFGIVGLLSGGGGAQNLEQSGILIIEKETGARYVWCQGTTRELCPVANYTSAKLLSDSGQDKQRLVSRDSLTKYRRGTTIGIPGAPDTLPAKDKLVKMPWSVCVRAADLALGGHTSLVTLTAGRNVGGQALPGSQAIVVQADGQPWVIWRNRRMRVSQAVLPALGSTPNPPQVAGKWLNSVAAGADFKGPVIPGLGQNVPGPEGQARAGQIYTVANVTGSAPQSYVLLPDGLAPITSIESSLLQADPQLKNVRGAAAQPKRLEPAVFTQAPKHTGPSISSPQLQGRMPTFTAYNDGSPLCATYDDPSGRTGAEVTLGGSLPPAPDAANGGPNSADQLDFPPGRAALAGVLPSPGKAGAVNTVFLITEGRRFALASKDVADKLGYNLASDAVPVPAGVVSLIPAGPVLDPNAARNPIGQIGGASAQPTG